MLPPPTVLAYYLNLHSSPETVELAVYQLSCISGYLSNETCRFLLQEWCQVIDRMDTAGGYGIHPLSKVSQSELVMNILISPLGSVRKQSIIRINLNEAFRLGAC